MFTVPRGTGSGFIWDDAGHVTNPGLQSWSGLLRIWFELGATQHIAQTSNRRFRDDEFLVARA